MHRLLVAVLIAGLTTGCALRAPDHLIEDSPSAQLFEGLGDRTRPVSTESPEAQHYFDQGIAWMYAFNHDEAIRSFARAAEIDPDLAMAWWGIALCEGPNYNDSQMTRERVAAAWAALKQAEARIENTTPLERALIEALATRYSKRPRKNRDKLNRAYADAMGEVWAAYPNDSDVGTLYAEALMTLRPWRLYSAEGEPEEDTPLIVETLERVMEIDPGNPGAAHMYIHAVEPSLDPDRGIAAADRLSNQMPGAGHLNHMPSHIYVQVGRWDSSVKQNAMAMKADDRYRRLSPDQTIQHMYMVHNAHMLAFSAMMVGREAEAMEAARAIWADIPEDKFEMVAGFIDPWMASVYDVQKRFGRWEDILAEPEPPKSLPITTAIWRAHRAVAYAALHAFENAEKERELFAEAREAIPEKSVFGGDPSRRVLEVSEWFIDGEIALQKGELDRAATLLETAVEIEDELSYGEPPQWLQPTRHTLGAVYHKAGRFEEAEQVFRDDLDKWRENGWSLFGLSRALDAQGKESEAAEALARYEAVWTAADEPTTTSCKCVPAL